jgi:type IV secretion system protein TrbG
MKLLAWVVLWVASAITGTAWAELVATPLPGDARLVQFEYDADNTFLVLARPKSVTHVEFGSDEQIITVAGGDTKNWELTPTANRRHLFIKPIFEQMETSMTVITDKRTYQFVLRSTGNGAKWYQRVTWHYGQDMLLELRAEESKASDKAAAKKQEVEPTHTGVPVEQLRFEYEISGEAPFRPTVVFSDGRFTWIRLPRDIPEWPALFAITSDSEAAVVNYVPRGEYMLAQQVIDRGVLKLGKQEIRFTRAAPRRSWQLFGGVGGKAAAPVNEAP